MENWCSYKNILVHLLFSSFFFGIFGFDNIFVSFHPNNMIFGTFWRVFKVLPKTGLEPVFILRPRSWTGLYPKTVVFIGLLRSWSFNFPVFCSPVLVQSQSFAGPRTRLPNTTLAAVRLLTRSAYYTSYILIYSLGCDDHLKYIWYAWLKAWFT